MHTRVALGEMAAARHDPDTAIQMLAGTIDRLNPGSSQYLRGLRALSDAWLQKQERDTAIGALLSGLRHPHNPDPGAPLEATALSFRLAALYRSAGKAGEATRIEATAARGLERADPGFVDRLRALAACKPRTLAVAERESLRCMAVIGFPPGIRRQRAANSPRGTFDSDRASSEWRPRNNTRSDRMRSAIVLSLALAIATTAAAQQTHTPQVTWPLPKVIMYPTPLNTVDHLNATADVPGTFVTIHRPARCCRSGFVTLAWPSSTDSTYQTVIIRADALGRSHDAGVYAGRRGGADVH